MKIHLVHAHSQPGSFVTAMRDVIVNAFRERGDAVEVSDLHAMRFNPVASDADFADTELEAAVSYSLRQRRAYAGGTLAPDIAAEIAKVLAADVLAFTFPVYWFGMPAILKGWIDRVFVSGTFYGGKRIYGKGGLAGKRALTAFSLGGREDMFGERGLHGELVTGMMRHFFQGTLGYVGLEVVRPYIAWNVPYADLETRRELLRQLREYVLRFETQPVIAVPNLDDFGPRFELRPPK